MKRIVKVARLLSEGRADAQMALRLNVSITRIKHDVQKLRPVIGARSRIDLAVQLRSEFWHYELFIIGLAQLLTPRRDQREEAWARLACFPDAKRTLQKLAAETGACEAELIRCAIDAYVHRDTSVI
jgi:hypothetical protein